MRKLTTPLTEEDVKSLHAGEHVLLSGVVYTARDAAHLGSFSSENSINRNWRS